MGQGDVLSSNAFTNNVMCPFSHNAVLAIFSSSVRVQWQTQNTSLPISPFRNIIFNDLFTIISVFPSSLLLSKSATFRNTSRETGQSRRCRIVSDLWDGSRGPESNWKAHSIHRPVKDVCPRPLIPVKYHKMQMEYISSLLRNVIYTVFEWLEFGNIEVRDKNGHEQ